MYLQETTQGKLKCIDFRTYSYGKNHFNKQSKYSDKNDFTILSSDSNSKLENIICINITGNGFKVLGTQLVNEILLSIRKFEPHCTRFDIAYDDFNKTMPFTKILKTFKKYMSGSKIIESRFKKDNAGIYLSSYEDEIIENIVYGLRGGTQYIRIYDKRVERAIKGNDSEHEYWKRFEIELRKECANEAYELYMQFYELNYIWGVFVNRMFRVLAREPKNTFEQTHTKDIPTAEWWLDFIGTAEKADVKFKDSDTQKTIHSIKKRVEQFCADALILSKLDPQHYKYCMEILAPLKAQDPKYREIYKDTVKYGKKVN